MPNMGISKTHDLANQPTHLKNKALNTSEIAQKKIILESKPLILGLILTTRCNLDCIMCCSSRNQPGNTLDKSAFEKISDVLPYLIKIEWQGGEIFYVDYLKDIFRRLIPYPHITHNISTNGLLLDAEWIEILLNLDLRLVFSIDSVVEKTYEYIRKGARFHELIKRLDDLNRMENRSNKAIDKKVNVVVMKSNYQHLDLFIDFAEKHRFHGVVYNPIMYLENEENIFLNMTADTKYNLQQSLEKARKKALSKNIGISSMIPDFSFQFASTLEKQRILNNALSICIHKDRQDLFCICPWVGLWVDISREANIYPDCWCQQDIGNIYRDSLLEIWNNEPMQAYRRRLASADTSLCKTCVEAKRFAV